jgi:hypothetical protein
LSALSKFSFSKELTEVLNNCKKIIVPKDRSELVALAIGGPDKDAFDVGYDVNGKYYIEANVVRCKNGASVNYTEDYMRRRDPDCLVVADELPTDKPVYKDLYKKDFSLLRSETFDWLAKPEGICQAVIFAEIMNRPAWLETTRR